MGWAKGFTRAYAEELFDLIVKFAGYGFNKSHSAALCFGYFYTFIWNVTIPLNLWLHFDSLKKIIQIKLYVMWWGKPD